MPLYDYNCDQCSNEFTELRRNAEMDTPIKCPECGNRDTRRTLTGFSVGAGSTAPKANYSSAGSPFS